MNKKFRYSLNSKAFIIGAIIVVLLLNAILITLNGKIALEIDFTEDQIFSLTEESLNIVDQIDKPTEILILTMGEDNETLSMVKNVLENYRQRNDKIDIREVDVIKNPAEVQAYMEEIAYLSVNSLIIRQGERHETVNAKEFFTSGEHGQFSYVERLTSAKLASFVDGVNISKVVYTTGHGESAASAMTAVLERDGYQTGKLDILTEEFPEEKKTVVVINAPQQDFATEEISKLDKYLTQGGNVQIYFDPRVPSLPNLEKYLAEDWGIIRNNHVILDVNNMVENELFMVAQIEEHDITNPLTESQKRAGYGPSNSLSVSPEKPVTVTIDTLLSTQDSSYAKESLEKMMEQGDIQKMSGDVDGPFDILVAATRETGNVDYDIFTGRLIVSGSSYIFNEMAQDTRFANEDVMLNTINWMNGGNASLTVRIKQLPVGSMIVSRSQFWTWFAILVVIVPVAILGAGLTIFLKRRYK